MEVVTKKRVAFLLGRVSEKGGISRVVSILSDELSSKEIFDIHIISYQEREKKGYHWNEQLTFHNLIYSRDSMKKGIFKGTLELRKVLRSQKIDVLIVCGHIVGPLGVLGALTGKTKLVYWSHSSFSESKSNTFKSFNERITSLFSNVVITLTKTDKTNYEQKTRARRVIQIYNPVDPKLIQSKGSYDQKSHKIISVGRLNKSKNFEIIPEVAKILSDNKLDFVWHIFGAGDNKAAIEHAIQKNNMAEKVQLKGQSNKLYSLYGQYGILVMTSKYEGFPMSLLEGLASGLPLVSFDIPTGPNEIIRDDINGYLIPPFEVDIMAKKIITLLENPDKRLEFSRKSKVFTDEFRMESVIHKWIHLINSL